MMITKLREKYDSGDMTKMAVCQRRSREGREAQGFNLMDFRSRRSGLSHGRLNYEVCISNL
jgi:hypothetical protein